MPGERRRVEPCDHVTGRLTWGKGCPAWPMLLLSSFFLLHDQPDRFLGGGPGALSPHGLFYENCIFRSESQNTVNKAATRKIETNSAQFISNNGQLNMNFVTCLYRYSKASLPPSPSTTLSSRSPVPKLIWASHCQQQLWPCQSDSHQRTTKAIVYIHVFPKGGK